MPRPRVVFLFSGQGSQSFQMARPLYERQPLFREWMDRLDDVARELAGASVVSTLYCRSRAQTDVFDRTLFSHPAIYMVEYALARTLIEAGVEPDAVLGTSLGTFAAAAVAGCIDARDALVAVIRHAQALEASCEHGKMIAVLAGPRLFDEAGLGAHAELAALNFASHFVVSASLTGASEVERILRARDIAYQYLPVSFAFHSCFVRAAEMPLEAVLDTMAVGAGRLPVVCCASGEMAQPVRRAHFLAAVRDPIRFETAITRLEAIGPCDYVDVGPSGTLATFVKYAVPRAAPRAHPILTLLGNDLEQLAAVVARFSVREAIR
ncbi:hypothetical protein BTI_4273 [Burkholderia thailandensis MSMB121]|uniref:acyltransferase domain-containing protein n=1 Tax=Burkholderia humptydooensis TaxID=430531 RepID=UPI0003280E25|nr:acyltransferase domain-containing protein [Burkholderia humptydooensis]AGK50316.1 hypothetical protein BTI_4273 [Burkholderia thailandensis MSMB121]ATF32184.1 malonyl CoA-ACP transacylase [Burkholderia thailandensis]